jgi:aldose 1-epimerase
MSQALVLHDEGVEAHVDPQRGGRLARLVIDGLEVLVSERTDAMAWGSYPMVPFAGRVRDGRFEFGGRQHSVPCNLPPHAGHGYGFVSEWDRVDDHTIAYDFDDPWPYAGSARQTFTLDDRQLTCTLEVRAVDTQPVMVGWHPWFRRVLDDGSVLELDVAPGRMYELDAVMIPTGRLVPPPTGPWDNCFVELAADPVLRWGDRLTIELSSSCDHWVIYDEPDHAICVEPQSAAPDEFNRDPLVVVQHDRLVHSMTLRWG